jgi:hypothetical protein
MSAAEVRIHPLFGPAAPQIEEDAMKTNFFTVIPAVAVIALTTTAALAQMGPGAGRLPRPAEQRAGRQGDFCADMKARDAARFAYIEQRLNLTAAQKPLFDKWKAAADSVSADRLAHCGKARPAANAQTRPTLPERNARREERLKQQLAALQKTGGPEAALYNALTAEQKQLLDRGGMRFGMGMRGGMRGGARFMGRGGMMHARFAGMRGPGRGGADAAPPAAPAPAR